MASKVKTLNKETKRCWVDEFQDKAYNFIKEEDKIPAVIVSYNRPKMTICDLIYKSVDWEHKHWPIYVVVRKSQEEDYKKEAGEWITVIGVEDSEINSAGKVRNWCLHHFDQMFLLDDDIVSFNRSYYEVLTKEDGNVTEYARYRIKEDYNISDVFALWQLAFEYSKKLNNRVICSSCGNTNVNFSSSYIKEENAVNWIGKICFAIWLVDCKSTLEAGIEIRDNSISGHEDLDFYCQILDKGYFVVGFNWITCINDQIMCPNFIDGINTVEERFKYQNSLNKKNWSKYLVPRIDVVKDHEIEFLGINKKEVKDNYSRLGLFPKEVKRHIDLDEIFGNKNIVPIEFESVEPEQFSLF